MNEHDRRRRSSGVARVAVWVSSVAACGLPLGVAGTHAGLWAPLVGFGLFVMSGLLGGLLGVVLGGAGLFLTRGGRDPLGWRRALQAAGLGSGLLIVVLVSAAPGRGLPRINDITTDLADPPRFGADIPDYAGRDMSYPPKFVERVRLAYPDLGTVDMDLQPQQAFERALISAESLGWEISSRRPDSGCFDARDRTAVFRFVDDVTVRVRPSDGGSRIDVRSKSRDGQGDLGANAARIRRFIEELNSAR